MHTDTGIEALQCSRSNVESNFTVPEIKFYSNVIGVTLVMKSPHEKAYVAIELKAISAAAT